MLVVSGLHIYRGDMPMLNRKQTVSCTSLLTGGLWKMKSQSCLCMQRSKAEPYVSGRESVCESVLACVSETTIGGLSAACTWHRTMSAGRCAWIKFCIGSLLHCPFSVSLCYLSTSIFPPHPHLHLRGVFGRSWPPPLRALCRCSFVRSGWDSALCVSLYTQRA